LPVVGADNNRFRRQLIDLKDKGLVGAAVTNPPSVGAPPRRGSTCCRKKDIRTSSRSRRRLWDNTSDAKSRQPEEQLLDAKLDPFYSVDFEVNPTRLHLAADRRLQGP